MQEPSRRRALLVEDETSVAMLLEDMLLDLGFEVAGIASTIPQALAMLEARSFDLALLDVNVGGTPAYAVAESLTRKAVPFIFTTGYGSASLREDFRESPVLGKPFRQHDLSQALDSLLRTRV